MRRTLKITATAALAATALTGCTPLPIMGTGETDSPTPAPTGSAAEHTAAAPATEIGAAPTSNGELTFNELGFPAPATEIAVIDAATATAALPHLILEPQDSSGYNRTDQFGKAWAFDANGALRSGGCDTRQEILTRDLTNITYRTDGCTVQTGVLNDPYTGQTIDFTRGQETSALVQIDHIIPLNQAWGSGADQWSQQARYAFANDPGNLLAVDGSANTSKSAKDAAQWLPDNAAYTCQYVIDQVRVKNQWNLSVDKAEHAALEATLATC